jgi:hypothetical protein
MEKPFDLSSQLITKTIGSFTFLNLGLNYCCLIYGVDWLNLSDVIVILNQFNDEITTKFP